MADKPTVLFKDGYAPSININHDSFSNDAFAEWVDAEAQKRGGLLEINVTGFDISDPKYKNIAKHLPQVGTNPEHRAQEVSLGVPWQQTKTTPLAARTLIDIASKDVPEALGGMVGGAAGSPLGPAGSFFGGTAGAGAGRALGAKAGDMYGQSVGLPPVKTDMAKEGLTGMAWEAGGRGVGGAASFLRKFPKTGGRAVSETSENIRRLDNIGIKAPQRWQIAETGPFASLFNFSMNNPFTARKITESLQGQLDDVLGDLEKRLARETPTGGTMLPDVARTGADIEAGLGRTRKGRQGWRTVGNAKYSKANAFLPDETVTWRPKTTTDGLMGMQEDMVDAVNVALMPAEAKRMLLSLTGEGRAGRISVPGGGTVSAPLPVKMLRETRTAVREARGNLSKSSEFYTRRQRELGKLEEMLTEDIYAAYKHHGGEAAETALREADKFWAVNKTLDEKYMSSIAKKAGYDSPVALYRSLENSITGLDTQTIGAIRSRLGAGSKEWDHAIDQYIRDRVITGRGNLDFDGFLKMRDDIGKSASMENLIFGKPGDVGRQYWDDVTKFFEDTSGVMKRASAPLTERKGSGTFSNLAIYGPLMIGGGGAAAMSGVNPAAGALIGGALAAMTPEFAWWIIKQPKIMKPLMQASKGKVASIPANFARTVRTLHGLNEDEWVALVEFMTVMGSGLGEGEDRAQQRKSMQSPLAGGVFGGQ